MDVESWVTIGSVAVSILSVTALIVFRFLEAARDRDKIRYGIAYKERFRACRKLYTRLSKVRDATERYTGAELSPEDRKRKFSLLKKRADAFAKCLRQYDILLDDDVVGELERIWAEFKEDLYSYKFSIAKTEDRKALLKGVDEARSQLKPYFQREYGLDRKGTI